MKATESLHLNAFLAALTQLDGKLPVELQKQLNDIGKEFPSSVSKLSTLAKSYSPLDERYKEARRVLRSHEGERLRFTTPDLEETARSNEEDIIGLAIDILNSSNSVASAKKAATESGVFKQLLVQLQGGTSFSVPDAHLQPIESGLDTIDENEPKAGILADLQESIRQARKGQTYPISALWDDYEYDRAK